MGAVQAIDKGEDFGHGLVEVGRDLLAGETAARPLGAPKALTQGRPEVGRGQRVERSKGAKTTLLAASAKTLL